MSPTIIVGSIIVLLLAIILALVIGLFKQKESVVQRHKPAATAPIVSSVKATPIASGISADIVAVIAGAISAFGETGTIKSIAPATETVHSKENGHSPVFKKRPAWSRAGISEATNNFI